MSDDTSNELDTKGDGGWEDDIDVEYNVPDRSTVSPDDLLGEKPGMLTCDQCEMVMSVNAGSASMKCNCGHMWRVFCVPAGILEELEER